MVSSDTTEPAILYEDVFASATILQCFAIGPLRHDEDDTAVSRTGFDTVAKRRWYFLSAANNTESLLFYTLATTIQYQNPVLLDTFCSLES